MKQRLLASALAVGTFVCITGSADAALLNIVGGTNVSPVPAINNVVNDDAIGLTDPLNVGYLENAQLVTTAANVQLSYFFMGFEAAWKNALLTPAGVAANNIAGPSITDLAAPGVDLFDPGVDVVQAAAGALRFEFTRQPNAAAPIAKNIVSNDGTFDAVLPLVSGASLAFQYLDENFQFTRTMTNRVAILLDDSGAGPDDNHDDWVGYVEASAVPVPAAVPLFLSGLAGMGVISRRRTHA